MTGIQKFAIKITEGIDKRIKKGEMDIVVPEWINEIPDYQNLNIVRYGNKKGIAWEQIDYPKYLKKNNKLSLNMTNNPTIIFPHGMVTIHDICCKTKPEYFVTFRDKMSALWHRCLYRVAMRSDMKIVTVSKFSKKEIIDTYGICEDRIYVVYNAY